MSHILSQWINRDVRLSKSIKPEDMDEVFRSGYLIAELLHKHKIIDSLAGYSKAWSQDAAIKNFSALEPVLKSIGCPISSNFAFDLVTGKPGSAAKLLYQIKTGLLRLGKNEDGTLTFIAHYDNYAEATMAHVTSSVNKNSKDHGFFVERLRSRFPKNEDLLTKKSKAIHTEKINRHVVYEAKIKELEGAAKEPSLKVRTDLNAVTQEKSTQPATMKRYVSKPSPRDFTAPKTSLRRFTQDADLFDRRLHPELSDETDVGGIIDAAQIKKYTSKARVDPTAHLKDLQDRLAPMDVMKKQNQEYLNQLKVKKLEEEAARREREQRRRKIILGQDKAREEFEKSHREHMLLERLQRQSKQERRIAEQLMMTKHEKEVMRQNRLFREQQYAERRQKDYEEALAREAELAQKLRADYQRETELLMSQYHEILEQKKQEKYKKHYDFCNGIVHQLIDFSYNLSKYNTIADGSIPPSLVREWKALFVHGFPVSKTYDIPNDADKPTPLDENPSVPEPEVTDAIQKVDEEEFIDYLEGQREWFWTTGSPDSTMPVKNEYLGLIVDALLEHTAPSQKAAMVAKLSSKPLKLAILGKPCSGKRTLAKHLADMTKSKVIILEDLIRDAIKAATSREVVPETEKPRRQTLSARAQLGARIQSCLIQGNEIDDALLVSLVADAVWRVETSDGEQNNGWILLDFPRTKAQGQLLEKELSGYQDPKPIKPGNIKRQSAKSADKDRKKSMIAPVNAVNSSDQLMPCVSAFDALFFLDIDNEVAIRRSVGRYFDPISGKTYHLEFNPPPNEPGMLERLVMLDDDNNASSQLQFQLNSFNERAPELKEWLAKFQVLQVVDATDSSENVLKSVEATLSAIIDEKKKAEEAKQPAPESAPTNTDESNEKPVEENVEMNANGEGQALQDQAPDLAASIGMKPPTANPDGKSRTGTNSASIKDAKQSKEGKRPVTPSKTATAGENQTVEPPSTAPTTQAVPPTPAPATIDISKTWDHIHLPRDLIGPSKELASILADQWMLIESSYTNNMKYIFRSVRRERDAALKYFYDNRVLMKKLLARPDTKQAVLDQFQKTFNEMEDDIRGDNDVKAELHQRVDDLRDKLWEIADSRKEEADRERASIIDQKWTEDHLVILMNLYIAMMQAEVDRFVATKQLVLDFTKDSSESPVDEVQVVNVKLGFVETAAQKDETPVPEDTGKGKKDAPPAATQNTNANGKKGAAPNAQNLNASMANKKGAAAAAPPPKKPEKESVHMSQKIAVEESSLDTEVSFTELLGAYNTAIGLIGDVAVKDHSQSQRLDKRRSSLSLGVDEAKEHGQPLEIMNAIQVENKIFKYRLDRIKGKAMEHLRSLKQKARDCFMQLDDWIGGKYQLEMDAIKQMVMYVKEAIECELKLPNELVIENEQFVVNYGVLTYEPEPEQRPDSPIETRKLDQFAVTQWLNLAMTLKNFAPRGVMWSKELGDILQRLATNPNGAEYLPENMLNADTQVLQQIVAAYEIYESGSVDWYKFIMQQAKILPVPNKDYFVALKKAYTEKDSDGSGFISSSDFFAVPLWMEDATWRDMNTESLNSGQDDKPIFNRVAKMKKALFYLFSSPDPTVSATQDTPSASLGTDSRPSSESKNQPVRMATVNAEQYVFGDHHWPTTESRRFHYDLFLKSICYDDSYKLGLEKAFHAYASSNDGVVTFEELHTLLHHGYMLLQETGRLEHEYENDPYPKEFLRKLMKEAGLNAKMDSVSYEQFAALVDGVPNVTACLSFQLADVASDVSLLSKSRGKLD